MSSEQAHAIINIRRLPDVMLMTGLPESSIYRLMAQDEFPRPVKLSAKRVGWQLHEVQAWISAKIEATKNETPDDVRQRGRRPKRVVRVQRAKRIQRPTKSTRAGRRIARN